MQKVKVEESIGSHISPLHVEKSEIQKGQSQTLKLTKVKIEIDVDYLEG